MPSDTIRDGLQQPTVNAKRVLLLAGGCMVVLFVSIAILALIYRAAVPMRPPPAPQAFPAPRLGVNDVHELQALRAHQRGELEGYRWVDRNKALISIPIERAMDLIAQRGAEAYGPLSQAAKQPAGGQP